MNQNLFGDGGHLYPNGVFFKLVLGIFSDSRGRGSCCFLNLTGNGPTNWCVCVCVCV